MDWKREAIDKLRGYYGRKASLRSLGGEIRQLEGDLRAIKSQLGKTSSTRGGGGGADDALVRNIAMREELKQAQKATSRWISRVDGALATLDVEERLVLQHCYMDRTKGAIDFLCEKLAVERATVYRRRDDALRHFTLAYYGTVES